MTAEEMAAHIADLIVEHAPFSTYATIRCTDTTKVDITVDGAVFTATIEQVA